MGYLENGRWHDGKYEIKSHAGIFVRETARFRDWVVQDPSARFAAEHGRYHLFISYACPWASRAIIVRALKGLEQTIDMTSVHPRNGKNGWQFGGFPDCDPDPLNGARYLYEYYQRADSNYSGRVTTPVLWDKKLNTIVSNESSEIIRMFNEAFNKFADRPSLDLYPERLRADIERWNARIYPCLNNGVYRAGFASSQEAYELAFGEVFAMLDALESHLASSRYLTGNQLTEADWRLFVTLVRFDVIYYDHFKCNRQRVSDYPALSDYLRELYQIPGIAETVKFDHIKQHYDGEMLPTTPTAVDALRPNHGLETPHRRYLIGHKPTRYI